MKIRVTYTVDVDPDAWAEEYALDRSEVRADVQSYFAHAAQMHIADLELAPTDAEAGR